MTAANKAQPSDMRIRAIRDWLYLPTGRVGAVDSRHGYSRLIGGTRVQDALVKVDVVIVDTVEKRVQLNPPARR